MAKQILVHYTAACHTCGWSTNAKNAQATAHLHANRNPTHSVELTLGYSVKCDEGTDR